MQCKEKHLNVMQSTTLLDHGIISIARWEKNELKFHTSAFHFHMISS